MSLVPLAARELKKSGAVDGDELFFCELILRYDRRSRHGRGPRSADHSLFAHIFVKKREGGEVKMFCLFAHVFCDVFAVLRVGCPSLSCACVCRRKKKKKKRKNREKK
jgi:hypothetical protein